MRHIHRWAVMPAAALCAALTFAATSYADNDKKDVIDRSVVQQGFDASPIPKDQLKLKGKDPALVGLGAYLVNGAADCNGCHTFPRFLPPLAPGSNPNDPTVGDPYSDNTADQSLTGQLKANHNISHFLAGGRCFGPIMSRNISPDPNHGNLPSGLTEKQFIEVMRTGRDVFCEDVEPTNPICNLNEGSPPPPQKRLQTMSWPTYHSLTDTDLKAIYAYLSSLPTTTACNTAANGCPPFSGVKGPFAPGFYNYNLSNTDPTCPNPPPPQ